MTDFWKELLFIAGGIITLGSAAGIVAKGKKSIVEAVKKHVAEEVNEVTKRQTEALLALLAYEIVKTHQSASFCKEIPRHLLEPLEDLYQAYSYLGGNGYISRLVEEIRKIPLCEGSNPLWNRI
jgi:hypothetical protein